MKVMHKFQQMGLGDRGFFMDDAMIKTLGTGMQLVCDAF